MPSGPKSEIIQFSRYTIFNIFKDLKFLSSSYISTMKLIPRTKWIHAFKSSFDHSNVKMYSFNKYLKMSTICQVFYVMGLQHQTEQEVSAGMA